MLIQFLLVFALKFTQETCDCKWLNMDGLFGFDVVEVQTNRGQTSSIASMPHMFSELNILV